MFQFCSKDFSGTGTMIYGRRCRLSGTALETQKFPGAFPENHYKSFTSGVSVRPPVLHFGDGILSPRPLILRSEIKRFGGRTRSKNASGDVAYCRHKQNSRSDYDEEDLAGYCWSRRAGNG